LTALYNAPRLLLTLTAVFWAGNFVIGRAVAFTIPPATLACLRWTIAFLILLPFALPYLREDAATARRHWRVILLLGLLGPASFNTLTYLGLAYTEALNGLIFNASGPILIAAAAFLIFGDRLARPQVLGLAAGLSGMLLVLTQGELDRLADVRLNAGDLLMLTAVTMWGIYTAVLRKRPDIHWQSFSALTFLVASVANVPLAIGEHAMGNVFVPSLPNLAAVAYVAVFPSLIAYIFYNRGVELMGAAKAGMYLFLIPVFGALLATLTLGEELKLFHLAAFALIVAGVTIGTRPPAPV
jgi:drug/metabolite transporter (DMT)-like permease